MKALKSKLAQEILRSGIKIPLINGAKFEYNGIIFIVKKVPKAPTRKVG